MFGTGPACSLAQGKLSLHSVQSDIVLLLRRFPKEFGFVDIASACILDSHYRAKGNYITSSGYSRTQLFLLAGRVTPPKTKGSLEIALCERPRAALRLPRSLPL